MGRPAVLSIRITAATQQAQRQLQQMERSLDGLSVAGAAAAISLGKIGAIGAAGLGLVPIATAATAAGLALGGFAAAAGPQMQKVATATQLYAKAQEEALTDSKKSAETMAQYNATLKDMPPATQAATRATVGLTSAFSKWSDSMSATTMPVFTTALQGLTSAIPALTPLVDAATPALQKFADQFKQAAEDGAIEKFTKQVAEFAGPSLDNILQAVTNLAVGFGNLFLALGDETAVSASDGLLNLTERFRTWSETIQDSTGFQTFVDIANQMWAVILELIPVALNFGAALLPLIGFVADLTEKMVGFLTNITPEQWNAIGQAIVAFGVAMVGARIAMAALTAAQWLLDAALLANPIGLVVAAIVGFIAVLVLCWQRSEQFRTVVSKAFDSVKDSVDDLTKAYKDNKYWIDPLLNALKAFGSFLVGQLGVMIANTIQNFGGFIKVIAGAVNIVGDLIDKIKSLLGWLKDLRDGNWGKVLGGLKSAVDKINPFSLAVATPDAAGTLPAQRALHTTLTAADVRSGVRAATTLIRPVMNLNVSIDGAQLQGRITRTVNGAMQADGARLQAGGWA